MVETSSRLTLEDARRMVAAADAKATADGSRMVIVVVDAGGLPLLLQRMDGANLGSIDIALGKARSSAFFGNSTADLEVAASHAPTLASLPDFVPFGGGLPIRVEGELIGAIAASGGLAHEDIDCAQAGLDAL